MDEARCHGGAETAVVAASPNRAQTEDARSDYGAGMAVVAALVG